MTGDMEWSDSRRQGRRRSVVTVGVRGDMECSDCRSEGRQRNEWRCRGVVYQCSETSHGVAGVGEARVEGQVHGLLLCQAGRRLLLLPPPQTSCLGVQVPLCGSNVRVRVGTT